MVLNVWASICIFSKLTRPSKLVLFPSCVKVMSFKSNGMKGTIGGCSLLTLTLYDLWFRLGSIRDSNSVYSFRNFEGSFSHVNESLDIAMLLKPITMAQKAFKFWYSLQLKYRTLLSKTENLFLTYYAANLMNFLRTATLLLKLLVMQISVITQNCNSLNLLRNMSKLAVICPK